MSAEEPIDAILERTIRQLLADLNTAGNPVDKERIGATIKHLQTARKEGLSGPATDDAISRLVQQALDQETDKQ